MAFALVASQDVKDASNRTLSIRASESKSDPDVKPLALSAIVCAPIEAGPQTAPITSTRLKSFGRTRRMARTPSQGGSKVYRANRAFEVGRKRASDASTGERRGEATGPS